MIRENAHILRAATAVALADLRAIYTWRTWTFGWLLRLLCQVAFFALIGRLLNSPTEIHYLVIGNSVYLVAMIAMLACVSAAWERQAGTLPLLVAAPAAPFVVFAGRGVNWLIDGTACASISLFALNPLFGFSVPLPRAYWAVPIIVCVGVSSYCLALTLSSVVLRRLESRNLVANLSYLTLMLLCGVQVPVTFLPGPIRLASDVLPLTHGLAAIRGLFADAPAGQVIEQTAMEILVGLGWLGIAAAAFSWFAERSRKDGSIEYGG